MKGCASPYAVRIVVVRRSAPAWPCVVRPGVEVCSTRCTSLEVNHTGVASVVPSSPRRPSKSSWTAQILAQHALLALSAPCDAIYTSAD